MLLAPLFLQRRWARISCQGLVEYRQGDAACDAVQSVQTQRSTRRREVGTQMIVGQSKQVEACITDMIYKLLLNNDDVHIRVCASSHLQNE